MSPRRTVSVVLALAALAAGCVPAPGPGGARATASGRPAGPGDAAVGIAATATPGPGGATPTPAATAATGTPSPAATATAAPAAGIARLQRPAGASIVLRGTVKLDAAYAVGAGAAVLANNGAAIVSNHGGGILTDGGAGLVSNNGGSVIANHGAGLISDKGQGLISDKGQGLISDKGQGVVANNGGLFRLAQAATAGASPAGASAAPLAPGTVLPAGGVVVGVVGLADGEPVSLGTDAAGAPAYAVYTDAAGGFEVYVPAALAGNVVVRARFPRAEGAPADPRLAYDVIAPAREGQVAVDEDTALATRYLLEAFAGRFRDFLLSTDPQASVDAIDREWVGAPPALRDLMLGLVLDYQAEAAKVGLHRAPRAEAMRVARAIVARALAPVDLDAVRTSGASYATWRWPEERSVDGLAAALRALRGGAAARLAADPAALDARPWVVEANRRRAARGEPAFAIRKASDAGDLLVSEHYVADMAGSYDHTKAVFTDLGVLVEPGTGVDQADRIGGASSAVFAAIGQALLLDQGGANAAALAAIRTWKPAP